MAEWNSARDYNIRMRNLTDGSGSSARLNGSAFLNNYTLHDDGAVDLLTGASGRDWFLYNSSQDKVTDLQAGETTTDVLGL